MSATGRDNWAKNVRFFGLTSPRRQEGDGREERAEGRVSVGDGGSSLRGTFVHDLFVFMDVSCFSPGLLFGFCDFLRGVDLVA